VRISTGTDEENDILLDAMVGLVRAGLLEKTAVA
jgi:histidinol-phosphate/aromatic aminotransferase/cobyric acid decarboxylase-like protein